MVAINMNARRGMSSAACSPIFYCYLKSAACIKIIMSSQCANVRRGGIGTHLVAESLHETCTDSVSPRDLVLSRKDVRKDHNTFRD